MTGRRSFGWTYNQAAKTKVGEALEMSRHEAVAPAVAEMSQRAMEPSNELSRAREGSRKRSCRVRDHDKLALLKFLPIDDDILAGLIKQQELVDA